MGVEWTPKVRQSYGVQDRVPMRGVAGRRSEGQSPASAGSFGQPQGAARQRIIAEWGDGFQGHVSRSLDGPLIVLLEQDGAVASTMACMPMMKAPSWTSQACSSAMCP